LLSFSQFGSDLDPATKKILAHGAVLMETLKQRQYHPYPFTRQVVELFAVKNRFLDDIPLSEVHSYLEKLDGFVETNHPEIIKTLQEKKAFDEALTASLTSAIKEFASQRK
jgi:F-type H+-transporting ATPase subunit alpha